MAVGDTYVFPGFLTPVLTQLFFPKPPITFLTCFCRGERRKNAGKKVCLNQESNLQPPGHESHTLTTVEPRRGTSYIKPSFCWNCLKQKWYFSCWKKKSECLDSVDLTIVCMAFSFHSDLELYSFHKGNDWRFAPLGLILTTNFGLFQTQKVCRRQF